MAHVAEQEESEDETEAGAAARREAARRRRLAEVFGEVLPETTGDERGGSGASEDWYRQNRPPHYE